MSQVHTQKNANVVSAVWTKSVVAGNAFDCTDSVVNDPANYGANAPRFAVGVTLKAAGTLDYDNEFGVQCTHTSHPAGYFPYTIKALRATTTVDVVLVF